MSSQKCPNCGSDNVTKYKKHGEDEIRCKDCWYDSGDKYFPARRQKHANEREREGTR